MSKSIERSDTLTKTSWILGGIWEIVLIIFTILIGVYSPFEFWWILIIFAILSIPLYVLHIILTNKILVHNDENNQIKLLVILSLLQLVGLNIILFSFGLVGSLHYRKIDTMAF